MNNLEYEQAFENRVPVYARVNSVTAGEIVVQYSCISAIIRRWSEKQNGAVIVLELLDENSNSVINILPDACFLSMKEAEGEKQPVNTDDESLWKLVNHYKKYVGPETQTIIDGFDNCLKRGMSEEVIKRVIEYAAENNSRNWRYINAILLGKLTKGIKTLADYNRDEKLWEERKKRGNTSSTASGSPSPRGEGRRSKFNNYVDTNKPDYSDFGQRIIEDMLREAGN